MEAADKYGNILTQIRQETLEDRQSVYLIRQEIEKVWEEMAKKKILYKDNYSSMTELRRFQKECPNTKPNTKRVLSFAPWTK